MIDRPIFSIWIPGLPETKGSWRSIGRGRMKRDNPREKAWSDSVAWMVKSAMRGRALLSEPVEVRALFHLLRPIGKKHRRDVDKLLRSVLDAMQTIVYRDDEQVTDVVVRKRVRPKNIGVHISVFTAPADATDLGAEDGS